MLFEESQKKKVQRSGLDLVRAKKRTLISYGAKYPTVIFRGITLTVSKQCRKFSTYR